LHVLAEVGAQLKFADQEKLEGGMKKIRRWMEEFTEKVKPSGDFFI
jgi:hypothetical protein